MNNSGGVTIGTSPTPGNASPFLDILGGRGNAWQRNFRVTYPNGFGLAGTELAGLAEIGGGYTWVALYANQGAATYAGYFNGSCFVNGNFHYTSDSRLKENFRQLDNSLQRVLNLKGLKYDLLSDTLSSTKEVKEFKDKVRKDNIGFIAQDVMKIAPELVITDPASGNYAINYNGFIPMLVEALKEQQVIIESLQSEIYDLKMNSENSDNKLKSAAVSTRTSQLLTNSTNALYQNVPNPFSKSTNIEYSLAENIQKAMICIYDMNGKQLKCVPLHLINGYGNITINGSELKAGMYIYSLITDEQVIDTKRMVLTD
jgi:hypothetical protein